MASLRQPKNLYSYLWRYMQSWLSINNALEPCTSLEFRLQKKNDFLKATPDKAVSAMSCENIACRQLGSSRLSSWYIIKKLDGASSIAFLKWSVIGMLWKRCVSIFDQEEASIFATRLLLEFYYIRIWNENVLIWQTLLSIHWVGNPGP